MKKFTNAIGVDVSKDWLDVYDHNRALKARFANTKTGFRQLLAWVRAGQDQPGKVLICLEHTGVYSLPFSQYLTEQGQPYHVASGLEIKRSIGLQRGKNDQVDAYRIAEYAFLRRDQLKTYKPPSDTLRELKRLLKLRERMMRQKKGYRQSLQEMRRFLKLNKKDPCCQSQQKTIEHLSQQIAQIDQQMQQCVRADEQLYALYRLVTSVKSVGPVIGMSFLVYTNGFEAFDNWRQFASYSGIAPFEYRSGKSIQRRKKVSPLANKRMKSLLSNAAANAIVFNAELREYYHRRLAQGKHKMATLNIIRNKIVARVFATVQRGTPYVDTAKYAC